MWEEIIKIALSNGVLGIYCLVSTWAYWNERKEVAASRELLRQHMLTDQKVNHAIAARLSSALEALGAKANVSAKAQAQAQRRRRNTRAVDAVDGPDDDGEGGGQGGRNEYEG